MDKRTTIMAIGFAVVIGYVIVSSVVYPTWIEPQLTLDDRITDAEKELGKLEREEEKFRRARDAYRAYVDRTGSFDMQDVANTLRAQLNALIDKHKLQEANVTPSRPTKDRKTELERMVVTVSAVGKLSSCVKFLKDVAELGLVVRRGNTSMSPSSSSKRRAQADHVNLRVPVELLVLPQKRILGRMKVERVADAEPLIRHRNQNYGEIWKRRPFSVYVAPVPLTVNAGRDLALNVGAKGSLRATARGGAGNYAFAWKPVEGLSDPSAPNPTIDTSEPFSRSYTVTATDQEGESKTASVKVNVKEAIVVIPQQKGPPPPKRWSDRRRKKLAMVLIRGTSEDRIGELMVYNTSKKQTEYYKPGDEFDGGELVFVHQRGGLVRRQNEYIVYPIGLNLDEDLTSEEAVDYPDLQAAARRFQEADAVEAQQKEANEKAKLEAHKPTPPADEQSGDAKEGKLSASQPGVEVATPSKQGEKNTTKRSHGEGKGPRDAKNNGAKGRSTGGR